MTDFWTQNHAKLVTYTKQQMAWGKMNNKGFEAEDVVAHAFEKLRLKEFNSEKDKIKYCKGLIKNELTKERSDFRRENVSLKISEIKDEDFEELDQDRDLPDINVDRIKMCLSYYNRILFNLYFIEKMNAEQISKSLPVPIPARTLRHNIKELKTEVKGICKRLYNL